MTVKPKTVKALAEAHAKRVVWLGEDQALMLHDAVREKVVIVGGEAIGATFDPSVIDDVRSLVAEAWRSGHRAGAKKR